MIHAIRTATPADLENLLVLLDEEFVFRRGRALSFGQRFPTVYSPENAGNIFIAEDKGMIVSALATKHFDWLDEGESFRGAMVGSVCTHPLRRNEGWASRLLAAAREKMQQDEVDFAVLWTRFPAIYARAGWISGDCGLLGELAGAAHIGTTAAAVTRSPADAANIPLIESIRRRWLTSLTLRCAGDYRHLPPPAEKVSLLYYGKGTETAGYALVGQSGNTGIVYEIIGHFEGFPALWATICGQHQHIIINDRPESDSHRWLVRNTSATWQDKPLAMWLPLSRKADMARIPAWYIPYFDRI